MEAVGVGCIWFAWHLDEDDDIDPGQFVPSSHVANIRRALENLESVTNLNVTGDEDQLTEAWGLEDDTEDNVFSPMFFSLDISFDVIVPLRFQGRYTGSASRTADGIETFHVKLVYRGQMPVAYIHYTVEGSEGEVHDFSPSTAVVVVRKFLEEKLKDHPTVLFQSLGPSPFHADIFIGAATDTNEAAEELTLIEGGYRTLYFRSHATTPDDQIGEFVTDHHGCISAFYELVRLRNYSRRLREAVTDGALDLLDPLERQGRWASFQHWRGYRERIDAVFQALLEEKLNRVVQDRFEAELNKDQIVDRASPFYAAIEDEVGDKPHMPDDDIRELLVMLEERRRGYFQNLSTLSSGLVGGLLGAALGAFLTFGLADHSTAKIPQVGATINNSEGKPIPNTGTK